MKINVLPVVVMVVCAGGAYAMAGGEKMAENSVASWGRHAPFKSCFACHGNKPDADSTDRPSLVRPVPQLCYTCHNKYAVMDGWKHGPVATGQCLVCHTQHQAENKPLLRQPVAELCYHCHDSGMLASVASHAEQSHANCTDCHEAHSSPGRMLLKETYLKSAERQAYTGKSSSARPRPMFVDRRGSLGGLKGVEVVPVLSGMKSPGRYGLAEEFVRAKVEEHLRRNEVRILSAEERNEREPSLVVQVRLIEVPSVSGPGQAESLSASINIYLRQAVELLGTGRDGRRRFCSATTWDTGAIAIWGVTQVKEGFEEATKVLVDRFGKDYLDANPKEAAPTSNARVQARQR